MASSALVEDLKALSSKLSGVKPGVKTTEFIVAAVFGIANFLVSIGVINTGIPAGDTKDVQTAAALAVGLISVGYSIARAITKKGSLDPLTFIKQLLDQVALGDPNAEKTLAALLPSLAGSAGISSGELAKLTAGFGELKTFVEAHLGTIKSDVEAVVERKPDPAPVAPVVPPVPVVTGDGTATPGDGGMPVTPPGLVADPGSTTAAPPASVTVTPPNTATTGTVSTVIAN